MSLTRDWSDGPISLLVGDAQERLADIADQSVHCCVTSPPYWGLRDYGVQGQLGLEKTPQEYVERLVEVFAEIRRTLRPEGTCWLNLGDSYASDVKGSGGQGKSGLLRDGRREAQRLRTADQSIEHQKMKPWRCTHGLKPKDLVGVPWRVALALQADGWWLRSDVVWAKPNPMPESVTDRPTRAHEYVFLLTKSATYFYDAEAVKETSVAGHGSGQTARKQNHQQDRSHFGTGIPWQDQATRNLRSVWTIASQPYSGAHFACFPERLVEPCILAGTSECGCCPECEAPWKRVVERSGETSRDRLGQRGSAAYNGAYGRTQGLHHRGAHGSNLRPSTVIGWQAGCAHYREPEPCTVLDPFAGSGTTLAVARRLGRKAVGIELQPDYISPSSCAGSQRASCRSWRACADARSCRRLAIPANSSVISRRHRSKSQRAWSSSHHQALPPTLASRRRAISGVMLRRP